MTETSTKWAVVEIGGKQHLVSTGSKIEINQLTTKVGERITLKSLLDQTPVTLEVASHQLGEKIRGLKFKNKIRYIRRYGHRQQLTTLTVKSLGEEKKTPAASPAAAKTTPTSAPKKTAAKKAAPQAKAAKKASTS